MRRYVEVRNWDRHQAYTAARPSWIKLHVALRDDPDFTELDDTAKAHVFGLWMLAASMGRNGRHILRDPGWLAGVIRATSKVDIDALEVAGFVSPCSCETCTSSSTILDNPQESSNIPRVEERRGEEKRRERSRSDAAFAARDGVVTGGTETEEDEHGDIEVLHAGRGLDDDGGDDPGDPPLPVRRDGGRESPVQRLLAVWIERYEERVGSTPSAKQRGKQGAVAKRLVESEALPDIAAALRGVECGSGPLYPYNVSECPEPAMWDLMTLEKLFPLAVAAGKGSGLPNESPAERAERIKRGIERERAAASRNG